MGPQAGSQKRVMKRETGQNRRLKPAPCASWGRPLLATRRVAWLTTFRVVRGRRVLYLGAAPRLVPPVPLNLTEENEENEASLSLRLSTSDFGFPVPPRTPFPHRSHTGHSPDTRRCLTVDNFRPPGAPAAPAGPRNIGQAHRPPVADAPASGPSATVVLAGTCYGSARPSVWRGCLRGVPQVMISSSRLPIGLLL